MRGPGSLILFWKYENLEASTWCLRMMKGSWTPSGHWTTSKVRDSGSFHRPGSIDTNLGTFWRWPIWDFSRFLPEIWKEEAVLQIFYGNFKFAQLFYASDLAFLLQITVRAIFHVSNMLLRLIIIEIYISVCLIFKISKPIHTH